MGKFIDKNPEDFKIKIWNNRPEVTPVRFRKDDDDHQAFFRMFPENKWCCYAEEESDSIIRVLGIDTEDFTEIEVRWENGQIAEAWGAICSALMPWHQDFVWKIR